jgi:hypothetical protein
MISDKKKANRVLDHLIHTQKKQGILFGLYLLGYYFLGKYNNMRIHMITIENCFLSFIHVSINRFK